MKSFRIRSLGNVLQLNQIISEKQEEIADLKSLVQDWRKLAKSFFILSDECQQLVERSNELLNPKSDQPDKKLTGQEKEFTRAVFEKHLKMYAVAEDEVQDAAKKAELSRRITSLVAIMHDLGVCYCDESEEGGKE